MGIRGFFDEEYSGSTLIGCYLNGIYEEHFLEEPMTYKGISDRTCFMVNTVNWLSTRIELGGEVLDLHRSQFSGFRRELDFQTGEVSREFTWRTSAGQELKLRFSRFLSMTTNELGYQRITFTPLNFSAPATVTLGLDFSAPHEMYKRTIGTVPKKSGQGDQWAILGTTKNTKQHLFAGSRVISESAGERQPIERDQFVGSRLTLDLVQGKELNLERASVLYTTREPKASAKETWAQGMQILDKFGHTGYQEAFQDNLGYWKTFWETSDISVEGDPEAQQGIRFCIFQMQQTYRGAVAGSNIGAKGLTGEAYNGNAFWDTETYCLPYYLFSNPVAAKALIDFRYKTLPQAMERAKSLDCQGRAIHRDHRWHGELHPLATRQPAVSADHRRCLRHLALREDHPGLGVSLHQGDRASRSHLPFPGQPWSMVAPATRVRVLRRHGPDEFQMMVNNNCYTNYMAKRTFLYTHAVLAEMEGRSPEAKSEHAPEARVHGRGTGVLEEHGGQHDHSLRCGHGIYEQHEGFFDLPHIDVDAIPVEDFPLYHNWSYDRITGTT